MKFTALILITLFFLGSDALAQSSNQSLTEKLSRQFSESDFPGFCVSVVDKDKVIYQNGFGYADVQSKKPYTVNTIQPVGSVSKTFIGLALMKAVELKLFSLETNVNDALDFKVSNPHFPGSQIKIKHLATHTSGIVDREDVYAKTYLFGKQSADVPLKDFLSSYLTKKGKFYDKRNFAREKPGAAFNYSNIGATLAAYLIESKAKMPFADFVDKYVLQPLAMQNSGWFDRAATANLRATLYDPQYKPYRVYASITYPDGSLRSSCADLSKYLIEIIKGYNGASNLLLGKTSFKKMLSPQFSPANSPNNISEKEPNQGIFFAFRRDGLIGHTGSDYGVSAFLFFNPKTSVGRIFLTNVDVGENPKLAAEFKDIWQALDEQIKSNN